MAPYTAAALGMKPLPKGADKEKEMMMGPDSLYEYELFAVVNHEGAMNTGHYTNFARFGDEVCTAEIYHMFFKILTDRALVVSIRRRKVCRFIQSPFGTLLILLRTFAE
jgi:hypothetical protein